MTAYVIGSAGSAVVVGAALGGLGSLVPDRLRASTPVLVAVALVLVVGLVLDIRSGGHGVPSWRRQVEREWIGHYRDWVTGFGFGTQLGLGFVTIITSSTTYAVFLLELLAGRWWAGALIGLVFGLVRSLPLVAMRGVETPQAIHDVFEALDRWSTPADRLARGSIIMTAIACTVGAVVA